MSQIDILAIGDLVIDAFIKLEDAEVNCRLNNVECELCVRYGDKVPYESVEVCTAVGNSPNAAVSASRLGLGSALFAYVGNDENGKACIAELEKNGVDTRFVKVEDGKKTNYHYVLWYDVDRTILVKHDAFSYKLGDIDGPKWIYLSSLGSNSGPLHDEIADYLEKNPDTKLAFQPGTFQMKMGKEKLARIYGKTEAFFCNVEEAQLILDDKSRDLKTLLSGLRALGPKIVVITDGFNGAYALDADGKTYFMPIYPHTPFERTGAGDAYASTAVACLAKGMSLAEALTWAPINSMSVVQQVGAQKGLLTEDKLKEYLANAPAEYKLKEI